jgi:hypothetical protein
MHDQNSESKSGIRAHDTRRFATSWALFNGATSDGILQTAHWTTETTFTAFYVKDVPQREVRFGKLLVLDTSRWAMGKEQN